MSPGDAFTDTEPVSPDLNDAAAVARLFEPPNSIPGRGVSGACGRREKGQELIKG
jgi:hypothetical protein